MKSNSPNISIRPYSPNDYTGIEKILKEEEMYQEAWDSKENYSVMIKNDPENILIAEVEGKRAGQIVIIPFGGKTAFLFRLAVEKDFRGFGVGSALLDTAEKVLKKRGIKEVAFFVNAKKEDLRAYYKKRGYITSGNKFIAMWKPL